MSETFKLPSLPAWSHWPLKRLREEKEAAPRAFGRGFEMRAFTDDERMFPSFKTCYSPGVRVADLRARGWPTFIGCDLAGETRKGNVIFTGALDPLTHHRYPLSIQCGAWTSTEMARKMYETHEQHPNVRCILVENNAYQGALVDWIKTSGGANWWWKVESFTTGSNKSSMEIGLPSLELEFNKKMWVLPESEWRGHPITCNCGWCTWRSQMLDYPNSAATDTVMACLVGGMMIMTARGRVPIESVIEGDLVLTHTGQFRRVSGTTRRYYEGPVTSLRARGCQPLWVTPEHPIWSADARFNTADRTNRLIPGVWGFRPAGALRTGRKLAGDFVLSPTPKEWPDAIPPRFDLKDFAMWTRALRIGPSTVRVRGKDIPRWLDVDEDAALFLGLYIAEGSQGRHGTMGSFAFHERETYLVDFVREQARRLFNSGVTVCAAKSSRGISVRLQSAVGARWLAQLGRAHEKRMPWGWMGWPLALRMAVVRGWLIGDGFLVARNGGHQHVLGAVTVARDWLEQARLTLIEAGSVPMIDNFPQPAGSLGASKRPAWKLRLSETDSSLVLERQHPIEVARWGRMLPRRVRTNSGALSLPEGAAYRLAQAEEIVQFSGMVYNLHVEEDESFVAEGLAVHNCWFFREAISRWGGAGGTSKAMVGPGFNNR